MKDRYASLLGKIALSLILFQPAFAQQSTPVDSSRVFSLGEVTVLGRRSLDSANTVQSGRMELFNRLDVGRALNLLPGVNLSTMGARNESMVYVRGFDLRQVPVFIDGIPVYVPYDGYVDLGRFTTFDLAEVNVAKGFSSVTYGPNTMGGAINLVSRRPRKRFEFEGRGGLMSGQGHRYNLNVGTNLGKFYFQASASQLKQETFPLSDKFVKHTQEDGGDRQNAYRNDRKYSLKVGFTPNATDEYTLSYVNQKGTKGTPPYAGDDMKQTPRFWQWPNWDKESWYFISRTALTTSSYLKVRLFYDKFKNLLSSFDDNTYTTQKKGSSFNSYYNDDTKGGSLEYGNRLAERHNLKASFHYKQDRHRENNQGEPVRTFIDQTYSLGMEDVFRLTSQLSLVPGISYNSRQSLRAENYESTTRIIRPFAGNNSSALNAQAGLFYTPTADRQLSFTVARKTRFATIKDRYSYRLGAAIPNSDLKAESALHFEAAYADQFNLGKPGRNLTLQGSLFYSKLTDAIQQVNNVQPNVYQFQNTGRAEFYGGDLSVRVPIGSALQTGVQYSYIHRQNRSNPDLKFIDVPDNKVLVFAQAQLLRRATLLANVEYNSDRYSTSYGTKAKSFVVAYAKASVRIVRFVSLEGGINNIFDQNYALAEGFPEPGRTYFVNLLLTNL
ncbi:TonB-dependent receptor plug domain-containing protein [Larkinella terrae]|uniref:TonB-dependent receptor plug domain-containing protein n=1 Tax=Larkinella terrae TaxID=2025311 RepID=A0A7K0EGA6_9BACT|nr:TonB-dependent receptor plug domain-containing protein [Larkinella terrae]MRS60742.1 TonB-dependent receptor plug domain-containing protein [Larkinella terrae]